MISATVDTPLPMDSYVALGLATCFVKREGKLTPIQILEPIPSAALEAIIKGIPTSYSKILGVTLGQLNSENLENLAIPADFAPGATPCDDFQFRAQAAARTYTARTMATTHIPIGEVYTQLNFSTERKRVLNSERLVTAEDNVKQHAYTHQVL